MGCFIDPYYRVEIPFAEYDAASSRAAF